MHFSTILLTTLLSATGILAAPTPAPAAIANPNTNSLRAPVRALDARYVVKPGSEFSPAESCEGKMGGRVKCL